MNIGSGNCTITDGIPGTPIDDADLAMNQYTTTPLDARTYDRNGNLTRILGNDAAGNALDVSCLYDYRNRMEEYKDNLTGQRHTYAYDALGRRIVKTLDADLLDPDDRTTRYYYGGASQWQVCEEQIHISVIPGTTRMTTTYVYGRYIDEVLQMQQRCTDCPTCGNGIPLPADCIPGGPPVDYYYHTDDLFNVMAVTDGNGTVVERYEYGDYGTPTIMSLGGTVLASSTIGNPYMFTGRRYDPETTWYNYRTRYLDPVAGRFTTRDVIGIWGDSYEFGNGYSFIGDNPFSWLDPFGLYIKATHHDLIDALDYDYPPVLKKILMDASDYSDRKEAQTSKNAFKHSMRAPGQSPTAAKKLRDQWMRQNEDIAIFLISEERFREAWFLIGQNLHAVMDSTSPAHMGWQVALDPDDDGYVAWIIWHIYSEWSITDRQFDQTVKKMDKYLQDFRERVAKEKEKKNKQKNSCKK